MVPGLVVFRGGRRDGRLVSRRPTIQGREGIPKTNAGANRPIRPTRRFRCRAVDDRHMNSPEELRAEILRLTREFSRQSHAANLPGYGESSQRKFTAGVDVVPYAGRVFNGDEVAAAVSAALDFWLTLGKEGVAFEEGLAKFLGVKNSVLCNSGSSANLLAV